MIYKFDRSAVQAALQEKGATRPCSRCGGTVFSIMPGFTTLYVNEEYDENAIQFGNGSQMPVVFVACTTCAAITMHGIGGLGLVDFTSKHDNKK